MCCRLFPMGDVNENIDPLTPETFSFFEVLEGILYPKDEVEVYLNEQAAYELRKLYEKISGTPEEDLTEDDKAGLLLEVDRLKAAIDASKYVFKITGVSDDVITDLRTLAESRFEDKKKQVKAADGTLKRYLPESEYINFGRLLSALVLAAHVEQIVAPDGRVMTAPGEDELARFMDKAPTSEKLKLQQAIEKLKVESSDFESKVDADFLAKP